MLITASKVRQLLLDLAAKERHHKFTRVSADTIARVEAAVRRECIAIVKQAPSKGATL